ncbi:MAG TPA: hypothetical protein VKG23_07135 [Thermoanaerobaculia bacterium]|nr:hypothetical protein [Thermoanaerobaculia bacterium]
MSLIDDALKRAQAADEAAAGKPADRPWIPTPMPDAGLARRRAMMRGLTIAVAVAAVAAAGFFVLRRAAFPGPPVAARDGQSDGRAAAAAVPLTTPTPLQVVVAVPTPVTPVPASMPAQRPRPTRAAEPTLPSGQAEDAEAPAPTPVSKPSGPIANGRTYAGSVTLPGGAKIELGGIVWSETEPRALLNDHVLATDSYVEGFRVAKIEEDRVALEKDGVTIYVSVK